ncbi:MAG: UvrB/UvrC motif-containing protein [Eubacteriaceae bacterium]|nr:UvrB/UvrC motif-containing protein [Eubacteriaceae bacterium]
MLCDLCKQYPATIMIKKIINGVQTEIHLCEQCAKRETISTGGKYDLSDFVKGVLDMQSGIDNSTYPQKNISEFFAKKLPKCPSCGLAFSEFRKTAKFGCENCYSAFSSILEPILKKMHGKTVHTGKIARSAGVDIIKKREISDIQHQLMKAVNEENFELAAEYRDMIKLLKENAGNEQ